MNTIPECAATAMARYIATAGGSVAQSDADERDHHGLDARIIAAICNAPAPQQPPLNQTC